MKLLMLILTIILLAISTSHAQQHKYFEKTLGNYWVQNGQKIIQENDSAFTICGNATNSGASWTTQFFKTNIKGSQFSTMTYSPPPPQLTIGMFDMIRTELGYVMVGAIQDAPEFEENPGYAHILFTDFEGSTTNLVNLGFGAAYSRLTNMTRHNQTGDLLIGGYYFENEDEKSYLVKTDALGNILWQKTDFGYNETRNVISHIVKKGDYYYLSLVINSGLDGFTNYGDILLIKIDGAGNILWEKELDYGTSDFINDFLITPDNEFFCTGEIDNIDAVFKLDSLGNTLWQNTEVYIDCGSNDPRQLADKSFVVTGCSSTHIPAESIQMYLVKFSNDGEVLWKRTYGNTGHNDYGYDLIFMDGDESGKSGYVVTGRTENDTAALVYLVRTNCMGLVTPLPQADYELYQPHESTNPHLIYMLNNSLHTYTDSIDGGSYIWTYGDGNKVTTSADGFSQHTYENDGIYTVTLTALVCNDTSRLSKTVCINANPLPSNITYVRAEANPNTLHFHADHPNAPDSVLWQLSNGTTSTDWSLPQTFNPDSVGSTITVSLTTYICEDTLTTTRIIDLWAVGIDEKEVDYFIGELHPNPAQTQVSLSYELPSEQSAHFQLFDLNGRLVQQMDLQGTRVLQLDISHLATGMYFYQIQLDDKTIKRAKLVVTK